MTVLLVVAKAPVPGLAKTRLTPPATPAEAADLAAAALLDTLHAVLAVPGGRPVVAMTGDLGRAARAAEVTALLARCVVIPQRGAGLPERLANAHLDACAPGERIMQIGMDTPQVTPDLLVSAVAGLDHSDTVLGAATDGGWWAIGLRDPRWASVLRGVPTSRADTGARTRAALGAAGLSVAPLPVLSDVDTIGDVAAVAAAAPQSRFAEAAGRAAAGRVAAGRVAAGRAATGKALV
jgi:glycosyltransferase A (GT-A) superfamily protein (DUF2064 family)